MFLKEYNMAPTVVDVTFSAPRNRFFKDLVRRMERKGVSLEEIKEATKLAYDELYIICLKKVRIPMIDFSSGNILILDYNPKTKKFLFGLIDIGRSISEPKKYGL